MDLYAQNILDRYKEPYHKDKNIKANAEHEEINRSCGDQIKVKLELENEIIKSYTFCGVGCAISMAAADILGDLIIDEKIESIKKMTKEELYEALGIEISPRRSKCALLALVAIQKALKESK